MASLHCRIRKCQYDLDKLEVERDNLVIQVALCSDGPAASKFRVTELTNALVTPERRQFLNDYIRNIASLFMKDITQQDMDDFLNNFEQYLNNNQNANQNMNQENA